MSELALYRKYRPTKFSEVIGQEKVVRVLEGSIKEGRISHAYLFSGSRGTGKTTIARIFARAVGASDKDIYELDAASNNGVDEVRALQEAVFTLPFESKYKVYIIDEAHMMSKAAFNAFLKTLEEPPSHVIFILATTDPEKLLETVVSRCQHFKFERPTEKILREMVIATAKKEGFSLDSGSADLVAVLGDGSFRDALGILQKIISASSDKKISAEEVLLVTGAPASSLINIIIEAIENNDTEKGLKSIRQAYNQNADMKALAKLLLKKIRTIMLLRYAPTLEKELSEEYSAGDFQFIKKIAASKSGRVGARALSRFIEAYDESGRASLPELPLELATMELTGNDNVGR